MGGRTPRRSNRARCAGAALVGLLALLALGHRARGSASIEKGPYFQNAAPDGITVCWTTDAPAAGTVFCRPFFPRPYPAPPIVVKEDDETQYHRVRVSGLKPRQVYWVTVLCEGERRIGSFITGAAAGQPFHFVAYGDTRTQSQEHAAVISAVLRRRPDFVLQTGDLVEHGRREDQWTEFFRIAGPLLRRTVFYPVLGNHDEEGPPYFRYFGVPQDYAFDYGSAHFMVLDTSRASSQYRAQEAWLERELATHQDAVWRIVSMHYTPYSCAASDVRRRFAERLRARLEPVLLKGRANLVITGHDHCYQHHFARGIHYLVTGGGGAPLIKIRSDTPYVVAARAAYHLCDLRVSPSAINVRAVQSDGTPIEEFSIPAER